MEARFLFNNRIDINQRLSLTAYNEHTRAELYSKTKQKLKRKVLAEGGDVRVLT